MFLENEDYSTMYDKTEVVISYLSIEYLVVLFIIKVLEVEIFFVF